MSLDINSTSAAEIAALSALRGLATFTYVAADTPAANLWEMRDRAGTTIHCSILKGGHLAHRKTSAPADGDLVASEVAWWLDATAGAPVVHFKGKDSGGTVFDVTVGSGSPGGSNTQLQYNNSGAFGGIAILTFDGTNLQIGTDASSPIGFWGATPAAQQASPADVTGTATGTDATIINALVSRMNTLLASLRTSTGCGILADPP